MVAVLVHEVVGVPLELLPHLLHDLVHVFLGEVRRAERYGLPVYETQNQSPTGAVDRSGARPLGRTPGSSELKCVAQGVLEQRLPTKLGNRMGIVDPTISA